jgi:cyclopropane fatty-acyl-phospholipid synthase-like methyltransferase
LPRSDYPSHLAHWLAVNVFKGRGRILDVGCGRGEYLYAFQRLGFTPTGLDSVQSAQKMAKDFNVVNCNIDKQDFPFPDKSFDYIFFKIRYRAFA